MTRGRIALTLLSAALVAGPMVAQKAQMAPEAFAAIRAQEPQRIRQATDHLMGLRADLGLNGNHAFQAKGTQTDRMGLTHTHFQQQYLGVRVWEGDVISHQDGNGNFAPPTDGLMRNISLNVTPTLTSREALAIAHGDLNPRGVYASQPTVEMVVFAEKVLTPKAGLARHANAEDFEHVAVGHSLAYHVHAELQNGAEETIHRDYMIDAHTGAILKSWNDLHTTGAVGTGNSQFSGTVSLNTNLNGSSYELNDVVGNMPIKTYNLNHATSGTGTLYTDADNTWGDGANYTGSTTSTTGATGQTAAVDAHYGIMMTSAMYKNVFSRNGIDGAGRATYSSVHYSTSYDNAFWSDTCFCMTYGDGSSFKSLEALDVAGHEMTHGVCANNGHGGLTYSGESGGLNEANSDIMGNFVVYYTYGAGGTGTTVPNTIPTANLHGSTLWTIGSQLSTTPLRYMYKPSLDGSSPDAWSSSTGGLDVHYSSGPANRMIYFLSQGATTSGNTSTTLLPTGMTGIGNDHAARIWYRALTTYFTSGMTYAQCRTACMNAASDLYGTTSAEYAAVQNAFHGINVGAIAPTPTVLTIGTNPVSQSKTAGSSVTFTVAVSGGTAPYTYQWYKNGAAVSGATSASYTFTTALTDNASTYYAKVMDSAATKATVTSTTATLTVTAPAALAIATNPASQTVNAGSPVTFTVGATGGVAPYSYQWYRGTTAISGATSASYTFTTATADSGAQFKATVSDATAAAVTSGTATLTVNVSTSFIEAESNNTISTANAVAPSYAGIQGYLSATGDVDYFALTLTPGQKLAIAMTGPSGVDWDLKLVNAAGTQLAISQGSTATESVTYTNPGTANLTVYANVYSYSGVSATPYNLGLTYTGGGTADTTAPTVSVTESGTTGTITFNATASDTVGVTKVEWYVDGILKGTDTTSAYSMTLDSTTLANGTHALVGKAYDAAGNMGTSTSVSFTVSNTTTSTDLVLNGGFESGVTSWTGTTAAIGTFTAQPAYAGTQNAWLGGNGTTTTEYLYQAVTVPSAATSATLSFYVHIDTAETTTSTAYDKLAVSLQNTAGTTLATLATYSNLNKSAGYVLKTFDLSAYKGQTVRVYFKATEDSSLQSSFVLDNISLVTK